MIKLIEVQQDSVLELTSNKTGKPYRLQVFYVHTDKDQYPIEVRQFLGENEQPYNPGRYKLGPNAISLTNKRPAELQARMDLVPLQQVADKK